MSRGVPGLRDKCPGDVPGVPGTFVPGVPGTFRDTGTLVPGTPGTTCPGVSRGVPGCPGVSRGVPGQPDFEFRI